MIFRPLGTKKLSLTLALIYLDYSKVEVLFCQVNFNCGNQPIFNNHPFLIQDEELSKHDEDLVVHENIIRELKEEKLSLDKTKVQITSAIMKQRQELLQHQTHYEEASERYRQSDVKLKSLSGLRDLMIGADSIDKYMNSLEDGLPEYEGMLIRSIAMTTLVICFWVKQRLISGMVTESSTVLETLVLVKNLNPF